MEQIRGMTNDESRNGACMHHQASEGKISQTSFLQRRLYRNPVGPYHVCWSFASVSMLLCACASLHVCTLRGAHIW